MKETGTILGRAVAGCATLCLSGLLLAPASSAAPDIPQRFDWEGGKIFNRFNETPLAVITATPATTGAPGKRNLNSFYALRQYPGSPPRIPHKVSTAFAGDGEKCISCHGKGGYVTELKTYAPVTPHPEKENCVQCHVPQLTEKLFVGTNWMSIAPPTPGKTQQTPGSPPAIPHSLQLRDDCIACHSGPAAVAEIRLKHPLRSNCRQCHVPMIVTDTEKVFERNK